MHSSLRLFILPLLTLSRLHVSFARRQNGFKYEALDTPQKRAVEEKALEPLAIKFTVTEQCPTATPTRPPILSIVYPSPDADPVEVTAQSQVVTSYIPEMTWCVGPPVGFIQMTANVTGPPYLNHSTEYSTIIEGTGSCETIYVPTETTICATTLTGLASKVAITECDQEITFSSECGFTLETPTLTASNFSLITPAPSVKQMMTYWMAPWQSLTGGDTPSDVDIKICTVLDNDKLECLRYQEVWEVVVVTKTVTSQRQVNLATTITGPGTLIMETIQIYITDTIETIDLSTILMLETEIETETTSRGKKLVTRLGDEQGVPASTVYLTKKVKYRSTESEEPTTTVRVISTATQYVTRTIVHPRPTLLDFIAPEF
ncbi:hypothetical protein K505DRAFT_270238 [Melanomma pulvis-pyrius CBS 109.77]|uniref:Uncharacterized protein n=1 Tax=Melanomma pulvis-pyrius CBS 109.77 TaxID=1314802 RepID=A0A6A6XLN7_9PLEO|nr:hypothetical protein K505DRAFT_270238 [Melanomma pulvis-pyrius CBS 109.77]